MANLRFSKEKMHDKMVELSKRGGGGPGSQNGRCSLKKLSQNGSRTVSQQSPPLRRDGCTQVW